MNGIATQSPSEGEDKGEAGEFALTLTLALSHRMGEGELITGLRLRCTDCRWLAWGRPS
jgi:hypothetical protein